MFSDGLARLAIEYQPIGALAAFSGNARSHSKHQIRQIAASIEQFGFTNPVLIDGRNTIIAGHGRVAAAMLLGMESVPTIRLEGMNEDEIRAYILADNRIAEKAGWDKSILAIELRHLLTIDSNIDVTVTGFEVPEIDLILSQAATEQDPDDAFEIDQTVQPVSQSGDLWQLDKHRILCGDALNADSYSLLMQRRRAATVFTDPP